MTASRLRVLAVVIGLTAAVACGEDAATPRRGRRPVGSSDVVDIRLIAFRPERLTIPVGGKVTWMQHDAGLHTVTSGSSLVEPTGNVVTSPDGEFASGRLAEAKRFSFTFGRVGAYRYFCEVHPATMRGVVEVGAKTGGNGE